MAVKKSILAKEGGEGSGREETRDLQDYVRPAVDIYETAEGLTLVADMPGVAKEHLNVDIDKGVLTLRGHAEGMATGEDLHREFALGTYFRQFEIPDEIDLKSVSAEFKDGVLTLSLPKALAARPRKIPILTH
ncbi:MAG: molecular chaperone [Desulfuromonas sp.]|uniref:Hsp20/alpha crystallin family protein n=1 Tax=Desulfuromonas sp. TaxID=892 RepID=UPI000CC1B6C0|nr:Hsp20/alpha crystallin family protein [Desulfuromonas sp.]PLX83348.1 MAG: molecular chaperone [Desulfuromonas sp.]